VVEGGRFKLDSRKGRRFESCSTHFFLAGVDEHNSQPEERNEDEFVCVLVIVKSSVKRNSVTYDVEERVARIVGHIVKGSNDRWSAFNVLEDCVGNETELDVIAYVTLPNRAPHDMRNAPLVKEVL
jgi:hypothetical protein